MKLDFDNFVRLFEEYYLSDDPGALGNFINGKLTYDEEESEDEDPGALVRREKKATLGFPRNRVRLIFSPRRTVASRPPAFTRWTRTCGARTGGQGQRP